MEKADSKLENYSTTINRIIWWQIHETFEYVIYSIWTLKRKYVTEKVVQQPSCYPYYFLESF